jgi:hypothetical protein
MDAGELLVDVIEASVNCIEAFIVFVQGFMNAAELARASRGVKVRSAIRAEYNMGERFHRADSSKRRANRASR